MSKQRAIVNCMRCSELLEDILKTSKDSPNRKHRILNSSQIYTARNDAMKALEEYHKNEPKDTDSVKALNACMNCDYKSPKIVEILKNEYFKK